MISVRLRLSLRWHRCCEIQNVCWKPSGVRETKEWIKGNQNFLRYKNDRGFHDAGGESFRLPSPCATSSTASAPLSSRHPASLLRDIRGSRDARVPIQNVQNEVRWLDSCAVRARKKGAAGQTTEDAFRHLLNVEDLHPTSLPTASTGSGLTLRKLRWMKLLKFYLMQCPSKTELSMISFSLVSTESLRTSALRSPCMHHPG